MADSPYENATVVKRQLDLQPDGGGVLLQLLHGDGPAVGHKCIHRVATDMDGRLKSDIVYLYDETVSEATVEADFKMLASPGLMSVGMLHHTASMLNRRMRSERRRD
jgi:hypothetical protein